MEGALILEGILLLFFSEKHRIVGDGMTRFVSLRLLFERGELADTPYSMVGPIFATPLYALDRLLDTPMWWAERYNVFVFVVGLLVLQRLLKPHLRADTLRKFLLLLVVGSMFPRHQMEFYGEVFTAVLAAAGLLALAGRGSAWGWLAILLAVANTPAVALGLLLASVALVFQHRQWRYLLLPVGAAALIVGEAWLRRGHPLLSGYEGAAGYPTVMPYSAGAGFSYPFFFGVVSILFAFGKGILFFAPGLLLGVKARFAGAGETAWRAYGLWLLFLAGMIVVYARWWGWYGGWFWGPRFFLFASLPASLALAVALTGRSKEVLPNALLLIILALSVFVAVNGVVFDQYGLDVCTRNDYALEALCWYVPEFSALFHPFVNAKPLTFEDSTWIAYGATAFLWLAMPVLRDLAAGSAAWARGVGARISEGLGF